MEYVIEPITCNSPRQELVRFLANFENDKKGEDYWRRRLIFWWDENPCQPDELPRGWVARKEGSVVGFLGAIPFDYIYRGQVYPALDATVWRVAEEHRNVSLPLFMKWHQLREKFILLDTTAKPKVARVLDRFNYCEEKILHYHFFPMRSAGGGFLGWALGLLSWLARWSLPQQPLKLVSLKDNFTIRNDCMRSDRLEKRISREYLAWYCSWPEKEFVGCVDADNVLTSYVIVEPDLYGKHRVLGVIDYFTTRADNAEILALLGHLHAHPESLSLNGPFRFLMLKTFEGDFFRQKPLGSICRQNPGKHHYSLPGHLKDVSKRCVAAEGDYGC